LAAPRGGADDGRPRGEQTLDEQDAHGAGRRGDEHPLAGAHLRGLEQPAGGQAVVHERGGVGDRQAVGDGDERAERRQRELGGGPGLAEAGHDAPADPRLAGRVARGDDPARDPAAGDVGRPQVEPVPGGAGADGGVEREDVGHLDGDEHLAGRRPCGAGASASVRTSGLPNCATSMICMRRSSKFKCG
jgi:hypothetical protein